MKHPHKPIVTYLKEIPFLHMITSPVIYAMIFPAFLLDLTLFLYQHIIFRIYEIPFVDRKAYFIYDRHALSYLNFIEKLNCLYCSYFNALMSYAVAIAAKTEQYFCPIKHAQKQQHHHERYKTFLEYGDGEHYHDKLEKIRDELKNDH